MTLQDAADSLGISKKRLWRAVKAGQIAAVQVEKGQRWEYRVTVDQLEEYRRILGTEATSWNDPEQVVPTVSERSGATGSETERIGTTERERSVSSRNAERPGRNDPEREKNSPPAEVYIALIDRLARAERRSVELELQLRQSQRLLTENAESITEKDAQTHHAQAQLEALEQEKQAEVERLRSELETTRHQLLEAQKPRGLFSWLGLRKRRTTPNSTDKAV